MSRNRGNSFVETWDFRGFGEPDYHNRELLYTSYNKKGQLVHSIQQWDDDADGTPESQYSRHIEYDRHGNPKEEHSGYDFHSGGLGSSEITIYKYDWRGNMLLKEHVADPYETGEFTQGFSERYTYDKRNNILSKVYEEDRDLDGVIDEKNSWFYTYDRKNNLTKEIKEFHDRDSDGVPDYTDVIDYTYDIRGNLTSSYKSFYVGETLDQNYVSSTWVYDKRGHLIHREHDDSLNLDFVLTWEYQYDRKGRLVTEIHHDEFDHGEDGRLVTKYIYDRSGNLVREDAGILSVSDWDETELQPAVLYAYDRKGHLIEKEVLGSYKDVPEKLAFYQWEYDRKGHVLSELVSTDTDGVPGYDTEDLKLFSYDRKGDLIREVHDYGNDGTYEWEYSKAPVSDSVITSLDAVSDPSLLL